MITTIPQLNEFLAAKKIRLDLDQRDMDHTEGLMLNAQFDQLAAARKLEEETAAVAVVEAVAADVVEVPQSTPFVDANSLDDAEIIWAIAHKYRLSFLESLSRIEAIDFNGMTAAFIEESQV